MEKEPCKNTKSKITGCWITVRGFKEESFLFCKQKDRLGRKCQVGEFHKYRTFIELINQNDFQWQLDTIWEVLFNRGPGEECYGLLETLF